MRIEPKQQINEYGDINNIKGSSNFNPNTLKFKLYTNQNTIKNDIITNIYE